MTHLIVRRCTRILLPIPICCLAAQNVALGAAPAAKKPSKPTAAIVSRTPAAAVGSQPKPADDPFAEIRKLYDAGKYAEALPIAEQAVERARANKDSQPAAYATALNWLGLLCDRMGANEKAEPLFVQALEISKSALREKHPDYAASLNNLAMLYSEMGSYSKAEPLYLQAVEITKSALGEKDPRYATSVNNLATVYVDMGAYAKAEPLFQQAVEISKLALGEKHPDYAASLNNLAALYERMGAFAKAAPLYVQAMEISKSALGGKHPDYAASLDNLAMLHERTGAYTKAEPLLLQALEIRRSALGEKHPDYAKSLNDLAVLYERMGAYAKAEPLFLQALELSKSTLGEKHPDYAMSLNNLATVYEDMGAYAKAKPLFQQAVEISKSALGEKHPGYATSLNNLARLYYLMGSYAKAEPLYLQALEIRKSALGEKHPDYADSLNELAIVYEDMGAYAKAEPLFQQAVEISKLALGEKHPDYAASLNNLARLYVDMGAYAKAEPLFQQALEIAKSAEGETHPDCAGTLWSLGALRLAQGDTAAARERLLDSIGIIEQVRASLRADEERSSYLGKWGRIYDSLAIIECASESGDGSVFEAVERGRARALADLLATANLGTDFANLREKEVQIASAADISRSAPGARSAVPNTRAIEQLTTEHNEQVLAIRSRNGEGANLVSVEPVHAPEIEALLGTGATLIEYHHPGNVMWPGGAKRDELWVFLMTGSSVEMTTVPVTRDELTTAVNEYAKLTADADSTSEALASASARLYDYLLAPLTAKIKTDKVVFVPWGPMMKIPLGALSPVGGEPLCARHDVVMMPSAGAYRYLVARRASGRRMAVVIGNPQTTATDLDKADRESRELAALFDRAQVQTGNDATETYVKNKLGQEGKAPDVVHFACHGLFDSKFARESCLLLSPDKENDGRLTMDEVFGLHLKGVSLVTLSACESGLGELGTGNDVIGLTRGFFYAGTPSVLCSLWNVDDEATRALMIEFYKQYLGGKSKPESLRLAQTAIRTNKDHPAWAHPYYWSAFVMFGDWQ